MTIIKYTPNSSRYLSISSKKTSTRFRPYENVPEIKNMPKLERAHANEILMNENLNYLTLLTEMTLPKNERFDDLSNFEIYKNYTKNPNERTANRVATLQYLYEQDLPFEIRRKIFSIIEFIRGHLNLIKSGPEFLGINIDVDSVVRLALEDKNFVFDEENYSRKVWQNFDNKIIARRKELAELREQII